MFVSTTSTFQMSFFPSTMEMDIDNVNNFNDIRERSHSLSNISSKSISIVSRVSLILYHERMIINNDLPNQEYVVTTTRQNGTCDMLTSVKLSVGYLVVGITRELDKEPSLHCYPIYISYRWSMLQQCVYLMSTPQ